MYIDIYITPMSPYVLFACLVALFDFDEISDHWVSTPAADVYMY